MYRSHSYDFGIYNCDASAVYSRLNSFSKYVEEKNVLKCTRLLEVLEFFYSAGVLTHDRLGPDVIRINCLINYNHAFIN
jgi:hypothetical protein